MRFTFPADSYIIPAVNPTSNAMACENVGTSSTTQTTNPGCEASVDAATGDNYIIIK
jgi:hypothetical protein